ncbi:MAG: hypothetical protein HY815_02350, partial [Candidatus Riflebacteria bacterium]|nr:hypothetical protein [Candidatus Riflebacteria bacterium]
MDIEKTGRHVRWVWFLAASLLVTLPGPARSQEEREIVQKDAETFATFYSTRLDALKEAIKAKDKEQAKAIEDRIHAEECRFLTRSVWTCRQQKSLEKNAAQLAAYLESYRARPVVERVKARLAAPQ